MQCSHLTQNTQKNSKPYFKMLNKKEVEVQEIKIKIKTRFRYCYQSIYRTCYQLKMQNVKNVMMKTPYLSMCDILHKILYTEH